MGSRETGNTGKAGTTKPTVLDLVPRNISDRNRITIPYKMMKKAKLTQESTVYVAQAENGAIIIFPPNLIDVRLRLKNSEINLTSGGGQSG